MAAIWQLLMGELVTAGTLTAATLTALTVLAQRLAPGPHRGARVLTGALALHLTATLLAVVARLLDSHLVEEARVLGAIAFGWVGLLAFASVTFEVLLPRLRVGVPRLVEDLFVAVSGIVLAGVLISRAGFDLTGLIATSAVVTAVIGLALQDTLGNTLSGLTLQFDGSIHVDDWIKVGDLTGRVAEIRWRYVVIETRNWETVLIPNGRLTKEAVVVLGRRAGQPTQWRRWVWFQIDFRHPPARVIEAAERALRGAPLANVAATPAPNCVLMEYGESVARYAVRYWLTDLAADDPTDSAVRLRLYAALERAGIPLALPAHAIFMTEDTAKRRERKKLADRQRRLDVLANVPIFAPLTGDERARLADAMTHSPYAAGEVITRQGQRAHWLYCILEGRVSVRVSVGGLESEVATLGAGEVFGEMSLLTGEPRAASAVAITDVECWRLDKEAFQAVLQARPEFAGPIADLLAERRVGLLEIRERLDGETRSARVSDERDDVLARMRRFLGLPG
jgi:small-conductance mechanosensitive channel/CRP-like cAMP-binding protein